MPTWASGGAPSLEIHLKGPFFEVDLSLEALGLGWGLSSFAPKKLRFSVPRQ